MLLWLKSPGRSLLRESNRGGVSERALALVLQSLWEDMRALEEGSCSPLSVDCQASEMPAQGRLVLQGLGG